MTVLLVTKLSEVRTIIALQTILWRSLLVSSRKGVSTLGEIGDNELTGLAEVEEELRHQGVVDELGESLPLAIMTTGLMKRRKLSPWVPEQRPGGK